MRQRGQKLKIKNYGTWLPKHYLDEYYRTKTIPEDEVYIYRFIFRFLKRAGKFERMLDVGSGPTIHHLIPFTETVTCIHAADLLRSNLDEIQKWINGAKDAHTWDTYMREVFRLQKRGTSTAETKKRESQLRGRIKMLMTLDIFKPRSLGALNKMYPLVTSFYCIECATRSKRKWLVGIKNLSSLVSPGGWLLMSALRKCRGYKAGPHYFPCTSIDEDDVHSSLLTSGFDPKTIDINTHKIRVWKKSGFSSILVLKARKYAS